MIHPPIKAVVYVTSPRFGVKGSAVDIPPVPTEAMLGLVMDAIDMAKSDVLRQISPPRRDAEDDALVEINAHLIAGKLMARHDARNVRSASAFTLEPRRINT